MSQKNHIWPAYVDMMTVLLLVYILMNCMFSVIISNANLDEKGGAASGNDAQQVSAAGNVIDQDVAAGEISADKAASDQKVVAGQTSNVAPSSRGITSSQLDHEKTIKPGVNASNQSAVGGLPATEVAVSDQTPAEQNSTEAVNSKVSTRNTTEGGLMAGKVPQSSAAGSVMADAGAADRKAAASSASDTISVDTHNSDNSAGSGNIDQQKHAAGDVAQMKAAGNQTEEMASSGANSKAVAAAGSQNPLLLQAYEDLYNNKPGDLLIKFEPQQESYLESDKAQVVSWLNKYKGKNGTYTVGVFVHDAGETSSSSQLIQQTSLYYQLMAIFKAQGINVAKVDIRNAAPSNGIDNVVKARFIPCQGECAVQSGQ